MIQTRMLEDSFYPLTAKSCRPIRGHVERNSKWLKNHHVEQFVAILPLKRRSSLMSPDTSTNSSPLNMGPAKSDTGPVLGRVAARAGTKAGSHVGKQQNVNRGHNDIRIGHSVARVDRAHAADKHSPEGKPSDSHSAAANETTATHELNAREAWLNFHASDLIMRLQEWATDLDAREASLNAAYARQDLRERQFRLCRQQVEIQIAEHLAAAKALRTEMQSHARRIAFELK